MMDKIIDEAATLIAKAAKVGKEEALSSITIPKDQFGDLSSKIAFMVTKKKKKAPVEVAKELCNGMKGRYFEKIECAGPYINFYFSNFTFCEILKAAIIHKAAKKTKKKVLVEFPSVNPNKPWHIGHLRNALLGDSVARILEFSGVSVERVDYIDDMGLQVAQSLWGVLNLNRSQIGKFDNWLGQQYVDVAKAFNENPQVREQVRNYLHRLEKGNNEIAAQGRKLAEDCVKSQYETAFSFGIYHDVLVFESDIMRELFSDGLEMLRKNNAIVHERSGSNAGCWVVKLSGEFENEFGKMKEPDKVLIRSDGTVTYTGKDIIFHLWKFGKLKGKLFYDNFIKQPNGKIAFKSSQKGRQLPFGNADMVVNVVGQEQKYPQKVVAESLKRLGFEKDAANLIHLAYEHVGLPDQKFSGREGTWVGFTADELLAEAKQRVEEKIKGELSEEERKQVVAAVGAGAIKFAFLRTHAEKKIIFTWEEALNMEGDSGPYIQYAYVRTNSILGKSGEKQKLSKNYQFNKEEKKLLKTLSVFHPTMERGVKELAPHHLCQYLLDVAGDFNCFYRTSPVLKADKDTMQTRLALVKATNIILANGLELLGIDRPDKM